MLIDLRRLPLAAAHGVTLHIVARLPLQLLCGTQVVTVLERPATMWETNLNHQR
jgi:hypothetical protein